MSSDWNVVCLEEICLMIKRGISPKYSEKDGVLVINQKCVRNQRLSLKEARRNNFKLKNVPQEKYIQIGDVLINSTGTGTLGRVAQVKKITEPTTVDSHVTIVRPNSNLINKDYFGWVLRSKESFIESLGEGSTGQTELSRARLEKMQLHIPCLQAQETIANILNSLDDKIELNRQICKTLENIADSLFKSWFIDFDPVKTKAVGRRPEGLSPEIADLFPESFIDSLSGLIPAGWKIVHLHDVSNIVYGKNLPTSELIENGFPVFGGNGLIGYHTTFLYDEQQVIIACRGAASGKIHRTDPKSFVTNNSLICEVLKNRDINRYYLEYMLKYLDMTRYATGSAQPQITIQNLKNVTFWIPKKKLMIAFGEIISSLHEKVLALNINTEILSEIRDTFLLKLISGEIKIQEAEMLISATI
ncbi:restriction endonuclease subunit S [Candidatus Protochlamydia phocaeensis]|uniref:restriction endonuclease subunit S n=1 Tax=Candidatus Protochlamydia phocaeensis TaxID=1414722 RepID=UPI0008381AEA|nr:restriction endonuclease subunit S [Candidatus Protochlamydia phocaeensis]